FHFREKSKDFSVKSSKRVRKKKRIPRDEEKESRTIFVGNVPNSWNKFKIKRYFSKYGAVENLRLRCPPLADPRVPKKVAIITKKFHPDRTNIHVFVCFVEKDSAYKALAANGALLDEHHIQVDLAEKNSKAEHDPRKAIFIGNLPFSAEEEDLWKMFEECGNIENIRVSRDKYTGVGRGFGYVNFQNADGVELALKLNGEKLKDRELRITRYTSSKKPKKQFRGKVVQSDENTKGKVSKKAKHLKRKIKNNIENNSENQQSTETTKTITDSLKVVKNSLKIKEPMVKNFPEGGPGKFQGQTLLDTKKLKKNKKKKLSTPELKKKKIIKQLAVRKEKSKN
ncbi:unnamed protein product, partial [Timema podura]|nr:unnamed protein product [Timema podura]